MSGSIGDLCLFWPTEASNSGLDECRRRAAVWQRAPLNLQQRRRRRLNFDWMANWKRPAAGLKFTREVWRVSIKFWKKIRRNWMEFFGIFLFQMRRARLRSSRAATATASRNIGCATVRTTARTDPMKVNTVPVCWLPARNPTFDARTDLVSRPTLNATERSTATTNPTKLWVFFSFIFRDFEVIWRS